MEQAIWNTYIYIYIYIFIHIFLHIYIYIHVYICIFTYTYTFIYLLIYLFTWMLKYVRGKFALEKHTGKPFCSLERMAHAAGVWLFLSQKVDSKHEALNVQILHIFHVMYSSEVYHTFLSRLLKRMTSHPKMWHKDCQTLALNDAKTEAKNLSVWELLVEADGNSYLHVAWWLDPKCSLLFCELNPRHVPTLW